MIQIWSYCMLGVKKKGKVRGYLQTLPLQQTQCSPQERAMKLLHFEKRSRGKKRIMVEAFKINIKPTTPGAFPMMHCSLLPTVTWDIVSEAGAEVYLSQTISVMVIHKEWDWEKPVDIHNADWLKITTHQLSSGHKRGNCRLNLHVWLLGGSKCWHPRDSDSGINTSV